jgi:NAD(P)-dependent dehydrogenase (short-subunit alcohol dehydrogenase family)
MSKPQKVVLITGVASDLGIGRATAKLFAQNNYKIIGIDRQAKSANDFPFPIDYYKVNLANSSEIQQCCEQICTKYTAIDVLVNNAGIHGYEAIDSASVERFDEIVAINFRAPWLLCKWLHKLLSKATDGGSIVNVSSVHASRTTENR